MRLLKFRFSTKTVLLLLLTSFVFFSCSKDDDDDTGGGDTGLVEDGVYLKGGSTAFADFSTKALFTTAKNEVNQQPRKELLEIYMAIKAGGEGFNIVDVSGSTRTVYGPGADWKLDEELDVDEPTEGLWKGTLTESSNKFTVPEDGLYHVIVDFGIKKVAMARVKWGVIGGATPNGWSGSTPMTESAFDLNKMTFKVTDLLLLKNEWKFRYSNGWKIILDPEFDLGGGVTGIKVNSNFGGAVNNLDAGGANIANDVYGVYTIELTWEAGKGYTASAVKTGDGPDLPEYPENLFLIGSAVGGWDWTVNDVKLVPVHSHPELFWGIFSMSEGGEFKFSPEQAWKGDFGKAGDATNGVYAKGTDNIAVPGASAYYMVVVDLKNETIEVTEPGVYLIGDAVGSWDAAGADNRFTVNGTDDISITKNLVADKELRMHVSASTLACDWWQSEFIILNGKIEFRGTGGDQERVKVSGGNQTIKLNFKDGTGSIN